MFSLLNKKDLEKQFQQSLNHIAQKKDIIAMRFYQDMQLQTVYLKEKIKNNTCKYK